ncbi:MAG: lytic transglycosylase domain-containing protein [Selenomonadaceae bacterium]|nr:lytic transglycosylase domain-containing protein [Selenomonadaceae bacterium]
MAARRKRYSLLVGCLILALSFGIYFLFQVESVQRAYLYPFPYQSYVRKYAAEYRVDSDLAAAVMKNESNFREVAQSPRGAVGLMQLMPTTAAWIAMQLNDRDFTWEKLHDPETNIRYGVWYLSSLQEEFEGNEVLMLAAYNAGRGNVQEWIAEYGWPKDFAAVDAIPFSETRAYVRRVLQSKAKYQKLYR